MTIALTGMGIVSPVGTGVDAYWKALCDGVSGIDEITRFDTEGYRCTRAGEVHDWRLPQSLHGCHADADLATQFVLKAVDEALAHSGLAMDAGKLSEAALVLATNFGGMEHGDRLLQHICEHTACDAEDFREYCFQTAGDRTAQTWGIGGPREMLSLSCSSGTAAIARAAQLIRAGHATTAIAGGYDVLSRFAWSGLMALRTISQTCVRPFDKNRDGTIFSEGAGVLLLEDADQARERNAPILAYVAGTGVNNNAFHLTAPAKNGAGSAAVMRMALADADMEPDDVDHVNAHGTGTPPNDVTETAAIKDVFGTHAFTMPVTSIKSMIGHMMGAAGAAEAIASVLSVRDDVIPPTVNFETPDPECDLPYVLNVKKHATVRTVLSNSAGIGGCNAAVIFRASE
ncbi:MAG: beta-ketoacyl-[acyl-carrier-protein] synthase family protein [Candidatus Pacebacteria bacterium]|nr:beta-ketoacyl-[acyl-carrier-protein] synthase family protein [Candidatus Paceibacterota bacterium]